jgi:regulator of RNase E activity RraA
MDFPVFGIGCTPADSAGRIDVVRIGEPVEMDGVKARNGDLILGDLDGVVIIPADAAEEALKRASEKVSGENTVREELRAGRPVAEVFRKHGIL